VQKLGAAAALILIDWQKAVDNPQWGRRNNAQAESNLTSLLAHWRDTARPVVHIRLVSKEPGTTFRGDGLPFKEEALPRETEPVFTKPGKSAFIGTTLEYWLRANSITELVITGVSTHNSVEATARMAGELGFRTVVVSDATFTFDRLDFDGRVRTAEEVHAMSLANLSGEYAHILSTVAVLDAAQE
jgi:nicotinamidase-related amidase